MNSDQRCHGEPVIASMRGITVLPNVVMLLTPVDMSGNSAGQLYLKTLTSTAPSTKFIICRVPERGYLEFSSGAGLISRAWISLTSRIGGWQTLKVVLYARGQLARDTCYARDMHGRHDAESSWLTLSSPECILLAHELISAGVKLRVTVWDAPEHLLSSQHIWKGVSVWLLRKFSEVLKGATSVSVISTNMQERYRADFGIHSVVLRPVAVASAQARKPRKGSMLRIVFAGSLYAKVEWNAFLKALAGVKWRIAGKRVVVYFVGAFPLRGASLDRHVKKLGYLPADEAVAICRKCDIAYLPYWLTGTNSMVAATSFPSKLSLYLSCGLPVLNHGPQTSEVSRLMRDYEIGVSCHSLDVDEIAAALAALVRPVSVAGRMAAIDDFVHGELSPQSVGRQFLEFLTSREISK